MNKFLLFISISILFSVSLFSQEPLIPPAQVGSYAAPANAILTAVGGTSATTFQTATALGLDQSNTNESQTFSAAGTTSPTLSLTAAGGAGGGTVTLAGSGGITLGQSGGTITITQTAGATYTAGTGISITSGVIANTGDADNSTTNEIQTLTRTSTNNAASLSLSGGSIVVEDVMVVEEFAPTSGTTVALAGVLPIDVDKFEVERNGITQNYGTGKGVISINTGTKVLTVLRAFQSGEILRVRYPKQ